MKFITPVAMAIPSQEDFERDLKEQLIKLGRKLVDIDCFQRLPILATCIKEDNNESNSAISNYSEFLNYENYYFIPTYNPQLYIALSSMTDEVNGIVGEWLVSKCRSYPIEFRQKGGKNMCDYSWRKATKEELINHFTKAEKEEIKSCCLDSSKPCEYKEQGGIKFFSIEDKPKGESQITYNTSKNGIISKVTQYLDKNGKIEFVHPSEHQKMITTYEGRITELEEKLGKQNVAIVNNLAKISNLERQLQVREDTQYTNFQPKNLLPYVLISTSEKVLDRVVFEVKRVNKTPTHHDLIFENEGAKERFKIYYDYELKDRYFVVDSESIRKKLNQTLERENNWERPKSIKVKVLL